MAGKKALDIVNSKQGLGTHVVTANLAELQSGIYLCRLQAAERNAVIKVAVR